MRQVGLTQLLFSGGSDYAICKHVQGQVYLVDGLTKDGNSCSDGCSMEAIYDDNADVAAATFTSKPYPKLTSPHFRRLVVGYQKTIPRKQ